MSYLGTATPYSANALTTNVPELGIELQQNGTVFPPGASLTIDESSLPTLKAVPVKQPGKEPAEGDFELCHVTGGLPMNRIFKLPGI